MQWYRYIQAFSIDVALGSCFMAFMVSDVLQITTPWSVYFSLGMSVWLIYTLDHLFDALKIKGEALTLRHYLHQRYFRTLAWLWLCVFSVAGVISLLNLPVITIKFGVLVAMLVVVHLYLVNLLGAKISIFVQKEVGVAITYTVGVVVGPLSLNQSVPDYFWWVFVQLFLCALINLFEFSYFDRKIDKVHGQTSLARSLGKNSLQALIYLLIIIGLIIGGWCFFHYPEQHLYQLILITMNLSLFLIIILKKLFSKNDYYRLLGDFVFLYPFILIFL